MNSCPCCSQPLLRHIRHGSIYWFCQSCRQEMPDVTAVANSVAHRKQLERMLVPSLSDLLPVSETVALA